MHSLNIKIKQFVREAGLVSVPHLLLKEVQDWVCAQYIRAISNAFSRLKLDNKINAASYERATHEISKAEEVRYILIDIYNNNIELSDLPSFEMNIPDFFYLYRNNNFYLKIKNLDIRLKNPTISEIKNLLTDDALSSVRDLIKDYDHKIGEKFYHLDEDFINKTNIFLSKYNKLKSLSIEDNMTSFSFQISDFGLNKKISFYVYCNITKEHPDFLGSWEKFNFSSPYLGKIVINFVINPLEYNTFIDSQIDKMLASLRLTVHHELIHVMQTAIQHVKQLSLEGGLPAKSISDSNYDVHGNAPNKERLPHELRDIEFYARLNDSIEDFKSRINKFPMPLLKGAAQAWTALISPSQFSDIVISYLQNLNYKNNKFSHFEIRYLVAKATSHDNMEFFLSLQKNQPRKYRKAVSEFFKSIDI